MKKIIPTIGLTLLSLLPLTETKAQEQILPTTTKNISLEYSVGISNISPNDEDIADIFGNYYALEMGAKKYLKDKFSAEAKMRLGRSKYTEEDYELKLNLFELEIMANYEFPLDKKSKILFGLGPKMNKTKIKSEENYGDETYTDENPYSGIGYSTKIQYEREISDKLKAFINLNYSKINSDNEDEIDLSTTGITLGIKF